jgi:2-oxoglutarate ferredoxin oxidoreductase subunit alpha
MLINAHKNQRIYNLLALFFIYPMTTTTNQPKQNQALDEVTIRFAGDSGDGMQLTGTQFTNTTALFGNDLSTFPDYPAEIRAPLGTVPGVSGFQIHFGSKPIYNPGDYCDVLVVMNAAALKANLKHLRTGGLVIANLDGFDTKNLRLAKIAQNPLTDTTLENYQVIEIDITKLTHDSLDGSGLTTKEIERCKNMFVLGLLYWLYHRPTEGTIKRLQAQFASKPHLAEANIKVLNAGWNYGETTEVFTTQYTVAPAKMKAGNYRNIMGNLATTYGLIAAATKSNLPLFYGSYPITPASDILHELSKHKNYGVKTFQAEDEIAAITATIGAAYGGALAITGSSGPGIALKTEAMGLAVMIELPLVIINVQRGGPSTGMPTKTEQADLFQALYGRNGEAPIPVVAPQTPSDCFNMAFEACRIALQFMTPVFFLSDASLANGAEPWRYPNADDLPDIQIKFAEYDPEQPFLPYKRNADGVRQWAIPGTPQLQHRVGGLEKEHETGNISYDPQNHELMTRLRAEKVANIAHHIPLQQIEIGSDTGKVLVLGWGGTYGAIKAAVTELIADGHSVAQAHIRYLNPLPKNLGEILQNFDTVLIPELNGGQLVSIIRDKYMINAVAYNKIQGLPFSKIEIIEKIMEILKK